MTGPLSGVRIVELGGIGPVAFAGMILAELGADVVRVDRPGHNAYEDAIDPRADIANRGKRSITIDLRQARGREVLLSLAARADALIEGFRPGVAERLGVGPGQCQGVNPRLVYGRMTGWGQSGPLAQTAGHDINYIALTGALYGIGSPGAEPQIPLNIVGDMGGGGTYLVIGLLAALHEAPRSGIGQVIDAAIVDGTAQLMTTVHSLLATGTFADERGANVHNGIAPYYAVYEASDGGFMAVGAGENRFYRNFLTVLGVDIDPSRQLERDQWAGWKAEIARTFKTRTRAEWTLLFQNTDCCVTPVLSFREAAEHPHMAFRDSVTTVNGIVQAGPAPRFSRTATEIGTAPPLPGQDSLEILGSWGVEGADELIASGVVRQAVTGSAQ